jgi:hypothetical protein
MPTTDTLLLARGCGRLGRRANRSLWLTVQDAVQRHPELAGHEPDIRLGWYAERAEQLEDGDLSTIGGGP